MKFFACLTLLLVVYACSSENEAAIRAKGLERSLNYSGDNLDSLIIYLEFLNQDGLTKDSSVYWELVKIGEPAIPILIENLTNSSRTQCTSICRKDGPLTVGDVSYNALNEIAEFPAAAVTGYQFCTFDENGCSVFYEYLYDEENKQDLKSKCKEFYKRATFETAALDSSEMTPIRKNYKLTEKLTLKDY